MQRLTDMSRMKEFLVPVSIWLLNVLGNWWASIAGFTDWSLFGWSFSGATVWVLYEIVDDVKRSGEKRVALIAIGLFMGLAFNKAIADWSHIDRVAVTAGLSLFGYVLLGPLKDAVVNYVKKKANKLTETPGGESKTPDA